MTRMTIPFGVNTSGKIVTATEVNRGVACECVCPQCAKALVAAKGDLVVHHFRHVAEQGCSGAVETGLHKFAKQLICERLELRLPKKIDIGPMKSAEAECQCGSLRVDVLAQYESEPVAIEIFVTHPVDIKKHHKFIEMGLTAIEIDLSSYRFSEYVREDWERVILHYASRRWLVHTMAHRELEKSKSEEEQASLRDKKRKAEEQRERELVRKLENQIINMKYKEEIDAINESLMISNKTPCLQELVERSGGYNKISTDAWDDYDKRIKQYNENILSGARYRIEHQAKKLGWI